MVKNKYERGFNEVFPCLLDTQFLINVTSFFVFFLRYFMHVQAYKYMFSPNLCIPYTLLYKFF